MNQSYQLNCWWHDYKKHQCKWEKQTLQYWSMLTLFWDPYCYTQRALLGFISTLPLCETASTGNMIKKKNLLDCNDNQNISLDHDKLYKNFLCQLTIGAKGIKEQAEEFHSNFSAVRKCAQQDRGAKCAEKKSKSVRVCACFDVLQKLLRV